MAAAKMKLRQREKSTPGKASASVVISAEASPDSKCPICLDRFNNMAYLDLCLHKFCFRCIHEWSKNKAECPLCKQPFNSIYHTIKSESDFKKYDLRPSDNGSFGNFGGERFRYRTTLTGAQHQAQRRTASPPDNGVMFEGPSGGPGPARQDRGLRRMMMRLAARRRAEDEGRTVRSLREQEMVKFRRALYRRGVRVRSVRDGGRSRDTSAEFFQRNPACLHRLVPFLKRELMVLYGAHGSLVNIVQHIIMSRITRYDMEDRAIEEELHPFLQSRTEHFLHEFLSFARAPFNMEAYDEHAVYDCPAPSSHDDSSSNSSVIAISEEEDSVDLDPPADSMSSGALSQTPWDDETPGPSYSTTTEPTQLSVQDSESESNVEEGVECRAVQKQRTPRVKTDVPQVKTDKDACVSSGDEDCVIVGFVKPLVERTPELVHLSSDSESVHEEIKDVPRLPQHIRFASLSPPSSPRQGKSEVTETERNISGSKEKRNTSGRQEASSKSSSRNKGRHDRDGRRHHSRDRSRERDRQRSKSRERRRRSPSADNSRSIRSPAISVNSDSTLFKGRRQSRSPSRDCSKWDTWEKKRDKDGSRSGSRHSTTSHSYHWHYYSQEREKESSTTLYTERRSYYSSSHRNPERHDSHSRSRSQSRERRRSRTRSCSPSKSSPTSHRKSRHEKPSGKRKYKTRHLEDPADDLQTAMTALSKPEQPQPELPSPSSSSLGAKDKKKSKEKHRKTSKEKSDRAKRSRSLSVEIVYEGGSTAEQTKKHHKKKKKKHKKKRHRSKERPGRHSPTVITIDSDSDHHATVEDANQACPVSTSSDGLIVKGTTTGNPSDSSLLESMLQDWEKQVQPPVALDNGFGVSKPSTSPPPSAKASDNDIDKCDVKHSEDVQAPSASNDKANSLSPANASESHSTDGL